RSPLSRFEPMILGILILERSTRAPAGGPRGLQERFLGSNSVRACRRTKRLHGERPSVEYRGVSGICGRTDRSQIRALPKTGLRPGIREAAFRVVLAALPSNQLRNSSQTACQPSPKAST